MRSHRAFYHVPVASAFLLLIAARERRGDDSQPGFSDRASITARAEAKATLQREYRIVPTPKSLAS
ncbi:hypothetical protein HNR46_001343 [Haloferula luteola]|uniref:Uncharacterized protein n=1 Tax=Haloferula luteola TaxID=595692 RepID=A0A840VBC3_9BACT|nr:hypothetical protein [Haloferula luteola]MBB5351109.1 hypothetical protein [Haloferula luteola]